MKRVAVIAVALLLAPSLGAQAPPPEVGVVEHLGDFVPKNLEFYDEQGTLTPLSALLDRPLIVTFVYYRCPGICSPLLSEVARIVEKMDLEPGTDYRILTLSFDPREKSDLAREKKDNYLSSIRRPMDPGAWRFFTGDSAAIRAFTGAVGFYYKAEGEDFVHAGLLTVLSREGKITRYLNGITFLPFDVKMAVLEAQEGRVGPTIATVLKFCYSYDPEARTYALNITRVAMILILLLAILFVIVFLVIPRFKNLERHVKYGKSG